MVGRERASRLAVVAPLGVLYCMAIAPASHAVAPPSWTQTGYDATHASFNRTERTIRPENVANLIERWHVDDVTSSGDPVVASGRVFVVGGATGWAFSIHDGTPLWKQTYQDVEQCCGVADPVVTPDGHVLAELGWNFGGGTITYAAENGAMAGTPVFHGGTANYVVRENDVFSYRFDYLSGGPYLAALDGPYRGTVFFGSLGARIHGPTLIGRFAIIALDPPYFGETSQLLGFDLDQCPEPNPGLGTCSPAWNVALPSMRPAQSTTPVGFGDQVVVATTNGALSVYDATTGALDWSGSVASGIVHPPAVAHGRIFVAEKRGVIRVFDARGCDDDVCAPIGRLKLGSPAVGQPVVAGNVLYAGTKDGRLLGFRARGCDEPSCAPLWSADLGARIDEGPIVTGGRVYATTVSGRLVAYGLPTR